ncbi:GntR family transcriptional regulator [Agrococcus carbonis]|uniref:DNA-binding transcriptional regulator, GntR family n=1 Tax=Agrococcus carbonis TaxID=684552 RepID=A0A1H1MES8_9MICO|nr:GntR family transcriptional regulator [Agrococcus carbonis]SDR84855.1 DNA-binding transcriptional regulator, GntR family [Agrococcus carbonis]
MTLERRAAPLREQAVEAIRASIVRGELQPGARITEKAVEQRLGVSRTVVREALRQLESERLIRIQAGSGPVVAELTADEARQLYEVRAALEAAAARLAAKRADTQRIGALQQAFARIGDEPPATLEELLEVKNDFYDALIAASHNAIIGEQLANVQARISQLRAVTLSSPDRHRAMRAELAAVVDAIARGDVDSAYDLSVAHVMAASAIALKHLDDREEVSA